MAETTGTSSSLGVPEDRPSVDEAIAPGAAPDPVPRHVAVIMDGNGRWAREREQPRTFGHQRGAEVARSVTLEAARLGVEVLTLYSFSTENWKRPREEVDFLLRLGQAHLEGERDTIHQHNIRFRHVGSRAGLPEDVVREFDKLTEATADNTGMTLALAINYGARGEITEAVRAIAREAAAGELDPEAIDEQTIHDHLYTASLPDPDLLIRTAGEMRLSNFLLWQISYAELWVTETYWPDFSEAKFREAIQAYGRRKRRFGNV